VHIFGNFKLSIKLITITLEFHRFQKDLRHSRTNTVTGSDVED